MVSPELLRRNPFFAGLSHEQIQLTAQLADEVEVEAGHVFFREDNALDKMYMLLDGAVAAFLEVPDRSQQQPVSGQLTGDVRTREAVVTTYGAGEVFGWSALFQPPTATSGAKATSRCSVVAFDALQLLGLFEQDCQLGYLVTRKAAGLMRQRLRDLRIESLTEQPASDA
jgi:CRP-like cAMP-binding protein